MPSLNSAPIAFAVLIVSLISSGPALLKYCSVNIQELLLFFKVAQSDDCRLFDCQSCIFPSVSFLLKNPLALNSLPSAILWVELPIKITASLWAREAVGVNVGVEVLVGVWVAVLVGVNVFVGVEVDVVVGVRVGGTEGTINFNKLFVSLYSTQSLNL